MTDDQAIINRIKLAHAKETHPNAGERVPWLDSQLELPKHSDPVEGQPAMAVRVTYGLNGNPFLPDTEADWVIIIAANDAGFATAKSVSLHEGVFAVGIYPLTPDGIPQPYAVAAYVMGTLQEI